MSSCVLMTVYTPQSFRPKRLDPNRCRNLDGRAGNRGWAHDMTYADNLLIPVDLRLYVPKIQPRVRRGPCHTMYTMIRCRSREAKQSAETRSVLRCASVCRAYSYERLLTYYTAANTIGILPSRTMVYPGSSRSLSRRSQLRQAFIPAASELQYPLPR